MNIYYMVLSVALCMNLLLIGAECTDCRITIRNAERWPVAASSSKGTECPECRITINNVERAPAAVSLSGSSSSRALIMSENDKKLLRSMGLRENDSPKALREHAENKSSQEEELLFIMGFTSCGFTALSFEALMSGYDEPKISLILNTVTPLWILLTIGIYLCHRDNNKKAKALYALALKKEKSE